MDERLQKEFHIQHARVIVKYRLSKLIPLFLSSLLCIALGLIPLLVQSSVASIFLGVIYSLGMVCMLAFLPRRLMKYIEVKDDEITIAPLLGEPYVIKAQDLRSIHKENATFHLSHRIGVISYKHAMNSEMIVACLLRTVRSTENTEDAFHNIMISGAILFPKSEDMEETVAASAKSQKVLFFLGAGCLLAFLVNIAYSVFAKDWQVILLICMLLIIGLSLLGYVLLDKRIEAIENKALRVLANISVFIVSLGLSIIISMGIYQLFMIFGIDLLAMHF